MSHEPSTAEAVVGVQARFGLDETAAERLRRLIDALLAEPDPPTTIRSPVEIADRHLADSLVALELPVVRGVSRLVDVGSGAGFPGLPLAIALPGASVDLVEASRRKCDVIERLAAACGSGNARAVPARAESWGEGAGREAYDVVTARAVTRLTVLAEYAAPLLRLGGALVAWRGRRDRDEERVAAAAGERLGLVPTETRHVLPFAGAEERHLHVLVKRAPTPEGFPRRPGRAAKRPLG